MTRPRMRRDVVIVPVAVFLLLGTFWLQAQAGTDGAPGEDSVDVGFAQDMQVHHAQAVEMADLLRERSSDAEVRSVARDIMLGQQAQIGEMRGWLEVWDRPITSTDPPMAWAHGTGGHTVGEMPGLASADEMAALTAASGVEADVLFLELMIRHHQGGVHMAEIAEADAAESIVRQVAKTTAESQASEIDYLEQLLEPRRGS